MKHDEEAQPTKSNLHKKIVRGLYKALAAGDTSMVSKLLSASKNVEWRFHGPPQCQYMMNMLTRGSTAAYNFSFKPRRIMAFRDRVIVEGWVGKEAYWVHVWTLDGPSITEFREYFNTWLTVLLRVRGSSSVQEIRVWQSEPQLQGNSSISLPHILLAI